MVHLIAPILLASTALALTPTLYSSHSSSHAQQITLTAPQSNAVLAHYLGVSEYERMPPHAAGKGRKGENEWLSLLEFDKQSSFSSIGGEEEGKIVVVLEGGKGDDKGLIPPSLTPIASLPSLPTHSYLALLALHLNRLSSSSPNGKVWGLDSLLKGLKSIDGWMGWVGDELRGALIKVVGGGKEEMRAMRVEEVRLGGKWVGELDGLDQSAKPLLIELEQLTNLVDSILKQSTSAATDDGPQGSFSSSSSQNVIIHLKGLSAIPTSSPSYSTARTLLRNTLNAAISSLSSANKESTVLLLSLPPYSPPLLRKRSAWLKPFNPSSRYIKNSVISHSSSSSHHKRATSSSEEGTEEGRVVPKVARTPTPIVPTTSMCFTSSQDVNNQTAECNGHGMPVLGISTRKGVGKGCWVCSCENGWGGEGCQKVDLSGDFTLLFFSSFGLIIILFVSVMFLYGVGEVELPGTLASVNGSGAGGKRD